MQWVLAVLPYPLVDPVAFSLGPLAFRWYALAYLVGALWAWWFLRRISYAAATGGLDGAITDWTIERDKRARGPSWAHVGVGEAEADSEDAVGEATQDAVRERKRKAQRIARETRRRTQRRTGRRARVRHRHKAGHEERERTEALKAEMKGRLRTRERDKGDTSEQTPSDAQDSRAQKSRRKSVANESRRMHGRLTFVPPAAIDEFVAWSIFGILIGGRLGYVLAYNAEYYFANPMDSLALWQGGMSFHGGMLGVVIAAALYAWIRGVPFLALTDLLALGCTVGLFLGRVANFINGELYGRTSDVAWSFVFPNAGEDSRHPSQLYEALAEGLLLFAFLGLLVRMGALYRHGLVSAWFLLGYGTGRFLIEYTREPDAQLGLLWWDLSAGQWLSVPMLVLGLILLCLPTGRIDPLRP